MLRKYLLIIIISFIMIPFYILGTDNERVIALLIDISLSVNKNDFNLIKQSAISYIQNAPDSDNIAMFTIGNEPVKVVDFTKDKNKLIQELKNLTTSAINTTIYDTIFLAIKSLSLYPEQPSIIIIFSDGLDENSTLLFDDVARLASEKSIPIYSVRIGNNIYGNKILKRLNLLSNGAYFDLSTEDINTIGNKITNEIANYTDRFINKQKQIKKAEVSERKESGQVKEAIAESVNMKAKETKTSFRFPIMNIIYIIFLAILVIIAIFGIVIYFKGKKTERRCPKCGLILEAYQLNCPNCSAQLKEEEKIGEEKEEKIRISPDLLSKTPIPEEAIENTFVLLEKPLLIIRKGKMIGKKFYLPFDKPTTIGRSESCDIALDDITISGQHCRIIPQENKFIIVDLNSTNGTFLNEKKIKQGYIKEGDIIRVGETQLLFKVEQTR